MAAVAMLGVPGCCPCDPPIPCCTRVLCLHCGNTPLSGVDVTITRTSDSAVVLDGTTDCTGLVKDSGATLTFCGSADTEYTIAWDYWSIGKLEAKWNNLSGGTFGAVVASPYTFTWAFHPCATTLFLSFKIRS